MTDNASVSESMSGSEGVTSSLSGSEGVTSSLSGSAGVTSSLSGSVKLKRRLGLFNGVAMIVGGIIGSGIFVSPKGVLVCAGSVGAALLVWAACGFIALIGGLCYAELGTTIPKSGAAYAYINEAFGPLPAFLFVWVSVVVIMPCSEAISGLSFAYYVLQPMYSHCDPPDVAVRIFAAAAICKYHGMQCKAIKPTQPMM